MSLAGVVGDLNFFGLGIWDLGILGPIHVFFIGAFFPWCWCYILGWGVWNGRRIKMDLGLMFWESALIGSDGFLDYKKGRC